MIFDGSTGLGTLLKAADTPSQVTIFDFALEVNQSERNHEARP